MSEGIDGIEGVRAVVWDFDGVLNRAAPPRRWLSVVARELGIDTEAMAEAVFRDKAALAEGREDVLDRIQDWLDAQGSDADAEDVLELWFPADHDPDPELGRLLDTLAEAGVVQVILTNSDPRRARWIEHEAGWGARVDAVFSSGGIGAMKPAPQVFAHLEQALAMEPGQILLIDDSARTIAAAEKRGWLGWEHAPNGARALAGALMPLLLRAV